MSLRSCIPVIPSADLPKTLRLWVEGLGFSVESEIRAEGRLTCCVLCNGPLRFMLNQRAGSRRPPEGYEGSVSTGPPRISRSGSD